MNISTILRSSSPYAGQLGGAFQSGSPANARAVFSTNPQNLASLGQSHRSHQPVARSAVQTTTGASPLGSANRGGAHSGLGSRVNRMA
jgi:hypothetical protein